LFLEDPIDKHTRFNPISTPEKERRFNVDCYGLTVEEYKFLLDDIEEAIAEGNRKYGFGEPGYIDADGNFYPFSDNDKPRSIGLDKPQPQKPTRPIPKVNPMPPRPRRRRIEEPGPLLEEVMLVRGILRAVKVKRRPLIKNE
jgi:hypothetical protein